VALARSSSSAPLHPWIQGLDGINDILLALLPKLLGWLTGALHVVRPAPGLPPPPAGRATSCSRCRSCSISTLFVVGAVFAVQNPKLPGCAAAAGSQSARDPPDPVSRRRGIGRLQNPGSSLATVIPSSGF
jgi:hypothetical protein